MALTYLFALALLPILAANAEGRRRGPHLATALVPNHRGARCATSPQRIVVHAMLGQRGSAAEQVDPWDYDPLTKPRPWWNKIGIGNRPPRPPVVGKKAWIQWWERLRSLVLLAAVVLTLGVLLAGAIGIFVFLLGFLLEQAVS